MTARKKAEGIKVLVADAVADGKGGFFPKGHILDKAEDLASLKAKGLVG